MSQRVDLFLAVILATIAAVLSFVIFQGHWSPDLSALYFGARFLGLGQVDQLYMAPDGFFGGNASESWAAMAASLGYPGEPALPYVYPPLWAALFSPIAAHMDPQNFFDMIYVWHVTAFAASIFLAYLISPAPRMSLALWVGISLVLAALSFPAMLAFFHNQPQITVTFMTLLALERYKVGAVRTAGVILAVAASMKITPAAFGLIFLMDRNWPAVMSALASGFALLAVSVLLIGVDAHFAFLEQIGRISSNLFVTPVVYGLQGALFTLSEALHNGIGSATTRVQFQIVNAIAWIEIATRMTFVAGVCLIAHFGQPREALYARALALWSLLILCGPLGWAHYVIGPMIMLAGMFAILPIKIAGPAFLLIGAALSTEFFKLLQLLDTSLYVSILTGAGSLIAIFVLCLIAMSRLAKTNRNGQQGL